MLFQHIPKRLVDLLQKKRKNKTCLSCVKGKKLSSHMFLSVVNSMEGEWGYFSVNVSHARSIKEVGRNVNFVSKQRRQGLIFLYA